MSRSRTARLLWNIGGMLFALALAALIVVIHLGLIRHL
jgi:hypothetical protein